MVAANETSSAIITVKGITGSNHCFIRSSDRSSRGERLARSRVPKLLSMLAIDIGTLLSTGLSHVAKEFGCRRRCHPERSEGSLISGAKDPSLQRGGYPARLGMTQWMLG